MRLLVIVSMFIAGSAQAAIPLMINHQGFVQVNGAPYTGSATFKFVIYDGGGDIVWTNDGSRIGEVADALPTPTLPTNGVNVAVANGLYSLWLGDDVVDADNMVQLPSSVFDEEVLYLRVIFDDGSNGEVAVGDQRFTSTAYAFHAAHADTAETATTAVGIQGYVYGGVISNSGLDAVNDLDVSSGTFRSDDNTFNIVCPTLTKRIDSAWASGDNAGGWDGFESLPATDELIYIWAIGDSTGQNTGDYVFSTSTSAPVLPSGYDKKRLLGARLWQSDEWIKFLSVGTNNDRWVHLFNPIEIIPQGTTATSSDWEEVDASAWVPKQVCPMIHVLMYSQRPGADAASIYRRLSGSNEPRSGTVGKVAGSGGFNDSGYTPEYAFFSTIVSMPLDGNARYEYATDTGNTVYHVLHAYMESL